jgi:hypothetical protein
MSAVPARSFWQKPHACTESPHAVSASSSPGRCESAKTGRPETMLIRLWMRTTVRKQVTSFGTFLSTLCHEIVPPPRLPAARIHRLVAHTRLLRAHRRALPPCGGDAAEAAFLGGGAGRALAD